MKARGNKVHTRMHEGNLEYVPVVRTSTAHGNEKHGSLKNPKSITNTRQKTLGRTSVKL